MATKTKTVATSRPKEPKMICQNRDCDAMGRYQDKNNFYKSRNVSIGNHPYCKECVNNSIDIDDLQTVYDILQVLDTPFIKDVWVEALAEETGKYMERYLELINTIFKS